MIAAPAYRTGWGAAYCGDSLDLLTELPDASVNLVFTSPPFALRRQKAYGNKDQVEYVEWLARFARQIYRVLVMGHTRSPGWSQRVSRLISRIPFRADHRRMAGVGVRAG